jgi:hypothetical protein
MTGGGHTRARVAPARLRTLEDSNRVLRVLVLPFMALFASTGCSSPVGFPERSEDMSVELGQLAKYFRDDVLSNYSSIEDEKKRGDYRNEVAEARIRAIDIHYSMFIQELTGGRLALNVGSDLAVLGLNAAGTVTGGASTKAILAAVSGGIVGGRAVVDKEVFFDKTMPVLVQAMNAARRERLVRIRTGLSSEDRLYTLYQALTDIEEYYLAGTLMGASLFISKGAGSSTEKSEIELNRVFKIKFDPADLERKKKILSWLNAEDVPDAQKQEEMTRRIAKAIGYIKKEFPGLKDDAVLFVDGATDAQRAMFIRDVIDKKD